MLRFLLSMLYYVEYFLVRFLWFVLQNLPMCFSCCIAYCIATIIWLFSPKRRLKIQENLQIAYPDGIPFSIARFTHKVFVNFMYTFFEFTLSSKKFNQNNWKKYVIEEGKEIESLKEELSESKVAVLCSAHLGNFTLVGHVVCYSGVKVMTVIRELYNPLLNTFFANLLAEPGNAIVFKEEAYSMFQDAVPQGICPGVMIDQYGGRKSLYVPFMGKNAYTAASPAVLANKFGIPIYLVALMREDFFRFRFFCRKIAVETSTEDKQKDLEKTTENINKALEEIIREYPEQWFWMHRRWRD
ncbi:MAG: hypothetical protein HUU50_21815 [Candidatus Brocadiae bacterium]|nr:hypothetical protein [Candidatus Brocadiia bacterium]